MKTSQTLLPVKVILLGALIAGTLACGYSAKTMPAAAGTMPTVAQLAPASATAGGAAFTLTVNGANFGSTAVVNWNGAAPALNTTLVSGHQLMVAVPAAAIATAGTVSVTVTNPGSPGTGMVGSGGRMAETSNPMDFTIH